MAPALAAKHPEIKTYSGRGIDTPTSSIRFDVTPLGFSASVRGPQGRWFIDPAVPGDTSAYRTYYGRDIVDNPHGRARRARGHAATVRRDLHRPRLLPPAGHRDSQRRRLRGPGADRRHHLDGRRFPGPAHRGRRDRRQRVVPGQVRGRPRRHPRDRTSSKSPMRPARRPGPTTSSPKTTRRSIRRSETSCGRTVWRSSATPRMPRYFGADNVTAAKVSLINRVTHIYEAETSIRLVLVANNDVLNLNTAAQMTGANGPCGGAALLLAPDGSRVRDGQRAQPRRDRSSRRRFQLRHRSRRARRRQHRCLHARGRRAATTRPWAAPA